MHSGVQHFCRVQPYSHTILILPFQSAHFQKISSYSSEVTQDSEQISIKFSFSLVFFSLEDDCGPPPRRNNEELTDLSSKQTYSHGEQVTYNCRPGYIKLGRIRMRCNNGNWVPLPPHVECRSKKPHKTATFTKAGHWNPLKYLNLSDSHLLRDGLSICLKLETALEDTVFHWCFSFFPLVHSFQILSFIFFLLAI